MRIQTIKSALRKYRRIYNTLIVAISISVFTYFYVSPEHPQYLVVATTSLLLCLMLGLFLVFSGKLVHLSIFIPTFLLWLYFCAPFFYSNFPDWDSRRVVDPVYFDEMALYCTLSIMGLVLGYYLATKIIKIPPIFYPNVRLNKSTLTTYAWVFLIIWWIYMVIKQVIPGIFFPFGQTIAILKHFNLFGGAFALITFLRGKYSGILILFALFSFLNRYFCYCPDNVVCMECLLANESVSSDFYRASKIAMENCTSATLFCSTGFPGSFFPSSGI